MRGETLTWRRFLATLAPGIFWLLLGVVLPSLILLAYSFLTRTDVGQVGLPVTLENWQRIFGYDALFQE